jgi:hypothetical protein
MSIIDGELKIDFFFPGVGKCGTTWVYAFLSDHSDVSTPRIKEPYFLDMEPEEQQRRMNELFPNVHVPLCDFSNTYFMDTLNPLIMRAHNSNARAILTVRRPSDRIWSHFRFLQQHARISARTLGAYFADGDAHHLVHRSDYRPIIERYRTAMGPGSVHVLPLELLQAVPQAYANELTTMLGIAPVSLSPSRAAPVMAGGRARNHAAVAVARRVADSLRKRGHLEALGRLKDNNLVNRLLFKSEGGRASPYEQFPPAVAELDRDYPDLLSELGYPADVLLR